MSWGRSEHSWSNTAATASVQVVPTSSVSKRYVIIDTAQRDWVSQPNPYSLLFSFGRQNPQYVSKTVSYYNKQVPSYSTDASGIVTSQRGASNVSGWYYQGLFFPPYPNYDNPPPPPASYANVVLPVDSYYTQPSGLGFGTEDQAFNVTSIRAVRVILPQKQFLNVPIVPGNSDSSGIQSHIVGKAYSTFSTYPYLMLGLNSYQGDYYGANEYTRKTFSALTQKTRTQTDFSLDIGVQHYDYEPWGAESHQVTSTIPTLQPLNISLTDPTGLVFQQQDSLEIELIQTDPTGMYLRCFTGNYSYFNSNDLRIGDRVLFHPLTLSNILKSSLLPKSKNAFVQQLVNYQFLVVGLLDYIPDANGIYGPRTTPRTQAYVAGYNGFLVPNFYLEDSGGNVTPQFPDAVEAGNSNVLNPSAIVGSNLPFLNTSLQPIYTLELTCARPDASGFGRNFVGKS